MKRAKEAIAGAKAAAQTIDLDDLEAEDATYQNAVQQVARDVGEFGLPVQLVHRQHVPNMDFGLFTVVLAVGQDGLVANTAKYVGNTPIIGVNPEPKRFDGVLLPFQVAQAKATVQKVLNGKHHLKPVTLAQVTLHDGQTMLAFNDFFVGVKSHVSARYCLRVNKKEEHQSSSGLLVSTGAGSTGWMSSVYAMAAGVASQSGAVWPQGTPHTPPPLTWDAPELLWAVREPFKSRQSSISLIAGKLPQGQILEVESQMSGNGVIFSDGIESDFLEFNSGTIARISTAAQRVGLVVP